LHITSADIVTLLFFFQWGTGRVDLKVLLDDVSRAQAAALFLRFYPDRHDLSNGFVERLVSLYSNESSDNEIKLQKETDDGSGMIIRGCSAASLQGHFVRFRDDPVGCIENIRFVKGSI
jgi:hypothetical protein